MTKIQKQRRKIQFLYFSLANLDWFCVCVRATRIQLERRPWSLFRKHNVPNFKKNKQVFCEHRRVSLFVKILFRSSKTFFN